MGSSGEMVGVALGLDLPVACFQAHVCQAFSAQAQRYLAPFVLGCK